MCSSAFEMREKRTVKSQKERQEGHRQTAQPPSIRSTFENEKGRSTATQQGSTAAICQCTLKLALSVGPKLWKAILPARTSDCEKPKRSHTLHTTRALAHAHKPLVREKLRQGVSLADQRPGRGTRRTADGRRGVCAVSNENDEEETFSRLFTRRSLICSVRSARSDFIRLASHPNLVMDRQTINCKAAEESKRPRARQECVRQSQIKQGRHVEIGKRAHENRPGGEYIVSLCSKLQKPLCS